MAASNGKTGEGVKEMVLDKTPSELRETDKARLTAVGVPGPAIGAFLDNTFCTPTDQTIIVASLVKMKGVANRGVFVTRASLASTRALAIFIRRRAELLAEYHNQVEPLADFVLGVPLNRTRTGKGENSSRTPRPGARGVSVPPHSAWSSTPVHASLGVFRCGWSRLRMGEDGTPQIPS
jgi:hypothetical protein